MLKAFNRVKRAVSRRQILVTALSALPTFIAGNVVATEAYPSQQVTLVVPYAPGGSFDNVARMIAEYNRNRLGVNFIVMNKPGAAGMIGESEVARANPDGYTILLDGEAAVINPLVHAEPLVKSGALQPVARLMESPAVIMTSTDMPANNLQELIDFSKKHPEKFNVALTGGQGQMFTKYFELLLGMKAESILFGGTAPAILSLMQNQTQMMIADISGAMAHLQSGKVKPLAISSKERSELLPGVPTAVEEGVKDYVLTNSLGAYVPAGTPRDIVEKINEIMNESVASSEISSRIKVLGATPLKESVADFERYYQERTALWSDVIKRGNLKIQ